MQNRRDRFRRLAIYRTNLILEKLRILGNLSNKANYDYDDDEVNKIFSTIDSQLRITKARFAGKRKKEFSL